MIRGSNSGRRKNIFVVFSKKKKPTLGTTHPLYPEIKQPRREAAH
jgi:hypothetical protein